MERSISYRRCGNKPLRERNHINENTCRVLASKWERTSAQSNEGENWGSIIPLSMLEAGYSKFAKEECNQTFNMTEL